MDRRFAITAAVVTAWSLTVAAAFIWIPGYWWDEAATVIMAGKPWEDFLQTLRALDAVHAAYYLGMRGWTEVFGFGVLATRMPSALAVAATSLVLVHLGRATVSVRAGVVAGVLYPLIPVAAWSAGEARSFALSGFLAAAVVLALALALDHPSSRWRWALLAASITLSGWVFLFTVLGVPGALLLVTRDQWRQHWRSIGAAVGAGFVGVLPLLWYAARQRLQVAWIPEYGALDLVSFAVVEQFFRDQRAFAVVAWLVVGAGAVALWRAGREDRRPLVAYAACIVLPTLVLILSGPLLGTSYYVVRYLVFTAPALAMILAIVLRRLPVPWLAVTMAAFLVLGTGPTLAARLDPLSKSSWLFAADTVAARAEPGDAMVAFSVHMTGARVIHPDELGGMPLLNETVSPGRAAHRVIQSDGGPLVGLTVPGDVERIWYLSDSQSRLEGRSDIDADLALLGRRGFVPVWTSEPTGHQSLVITLLERG